MMLATVAYRITTDNSFAEMLHNNLEKALQQAGIALTADEKSALQKILAMHGKISAAHNYRFTFEPWTVEL